MSLFRAIFGKDKEQFRQITERVSIAAEENQRAADRLIEALDVRSKLIRREAENQRAFINAISHKQRRFKGGFP